MLTAELLVAFFHTEKKRIIIIIIIVIVVIVIVIVINVGTDQSISTPFIILDNLISIVPLQFFIVIGEDLISIPYLVVYVVTHHFFMHIEQPYGNPNFKQKESLLTFPYDDTSM